MPKTSNLLMRNLLIPRQTKQTVTIMTCIQVNHHFVQYFAFLCGISAHFLSSIFKTDLWAKWLDDSWNGRQSNGNE